MHLLWIISCGKSESTKQSTLELINPVVNRKDESEEQEPQGQEPERARASEGPGECPGGGRGIGAATAQHFHDEGATVFVWEIRAEESGSEETGAEESGTDSGDGH